MQGGRGSGELQEADLEAVRRGLSDLEQRCKSRKTTTDPFKRHV